MKIDFSQTITDIRTGKPAVQEDGEPLTLRAVAQNALLMNLKGDENATGAMKADLYRIALSLRPGETDVSIEDMALIKSRIGVMYSAAVVGPAFAMLESGSLAGDNLHS